MIWAQFIPIEPCAKARPRVTARGTYMPKGYQLWRKKFVLLCRPPSEAITGHYSVTVKIFTKSGKMRPDLDNVFGAVADALQDAKVIANDRDITHLECSIAQGDKAGIEIGIW